MSYNRELILSFKQINNELLIHPWERFRGIAFELVHGLRDWMLMYSFYCRLTMSSKSYVNGQSGKTFMNLLLPMLMFYLMVYYLKTRLKIVWRKWLHLKNLLMIDRSFIILM
jgi:hypothetical protein